MATNPCLTKLNLSLEFWQADRSHLVSRWRSCYLVIGDPLLTGTNLKQRNLSFEWKVQTNLEEGENRANASNVNYEVYLSHVKYEIYLALPDEYSGVKAGSGKAQAVRWPGARSDCPAVPTLQNCSAHPGFRATLFCPDPHSLVPTAASQHISCTIHSILRGSDIIESPSTWPVNRFHV